MVKENLAGKRFGKLTVVSPAPNKGNKTCWNCLCDGFEGSTRLLEIADDIEELKTICACGKKATFNIRKMNGMPMFDGEQVLIDGTDKIEYEAVCGKCLIKQKGRVR